MFNWFRKKDSEQEIRDKIKKLHNEKQKIKEQQRKLQDELKKRFNRI